MSRKLPSLSGLEDTLGAIVSMDQLEELGWASAGGALGAVALSFARPLVGKIPFLGSYPAVAEILAGAVLARVAMEFNDTLAHGLAGATVGRSAAKMLLGMLNRPLDGISALPEEVELAQTDQLGPMTDEVSLDSSSFAEAEMVPELGGSVEEDVPLGAWIS